jgi:hypothetical protein
MTQSEQSSFDATSELTSEELTRRAERLLELSQGFPGDNSVEASEGPVYRWLFTTWIRNINNPTGFGFRVRNPERYQVFDIPGATNLTKVNWIAPWVDNPTEFSNKSITFRARPSSSDPSNPGTRVFRVFFDFDNDIVSWVPEGQDYNMRNPIERNAVGSGIFLQPVRTIDLTINSVGNPSRFVPSATVVTS